MVHDGGDRPGRGTGLDAGICAGPVTGPVTGPGAGPVTGPVAPADTVAPGGGAAGSGPGAGPQTGRGIAGGGPPDPGPGSGREGRRAVAPAPPPPPRAVHGTGKRVLVIDDEPNISEAIRFILRRDGWSVAMHATGAGALERILAEAPDLVILDLMLPGQSGLEILQALRLSQGLERLPVILLTARGQAATRDLAQGYGASLFMAKPFANAELLAAVRQLVGV